MCLLIYLFLINLYQGDTNETVSRLKWVKIRNRAEESEISLRYLKELNNNHEKWFSGMDPRKVLVINNDIEKYNSSDYENDIARIKSFVSEMTTGD